MINSIFTLILSLLMANNSFSKVIEPPQINGTDLPFTIEYPAKNSKGTVILVHGSGPNNMDVDLSSISLPKDTTNLFFKDIASTIRDKGFTTLRYDKRSYSAAELIKRKIGYEESEEYIKFLNDPMQIFYDDLLIFIKYAKSLDPKQKIYILGHSQGTNLALFALNESQDVDGVILIGFYNEPLTTVSFEQIVYRSSRYFTSLDIDSNFNLDIVELKQSPQLLRKMGTIDLDRNGELDLTEFNSANYLNYLFVDQFHNASIRNFEIKMGRPSDILKKIKKKVLFLHGEWDNQTPSYVVKAIETANNIVWKNSNLKFKYFAQRGHALDLRSSFDDVFYRKLDTPVLEDISNTIDSYFYLN